MKFFFKDWFPNKIDYIQTAVGDKYVFEEMQKNDYWVGGEQSGHIIFLEHEVTGDGLMTSLKILEIMKATGKSLKNLTYLNFPFDVIAILELVAKLFIPSGTDAFQ